MNRNRDWFGNLLIWLIDNVTKRPIAFGVSFMFVAMIILGIFGPIGSLLMETM